MSINVTSANGMGSVSTTPSGITYPTTGMKVEDHMQVSQDYIATPGIPKDTDLKVTQRGAGANMSVDVAAGTGYILNASYAENSVSQNKFWRFINDATVNATVAAAHATLNRYDLVCAKFDTGATPNADADNLVTIISSGVDATLQGTPGASPNIPATPNNYLLLAVVYVGAAVGSIVNANITDNRKIASLQPVAGQSSIVTNGQFSVTVASNNITVALLTLDGSTPSTSNPVWVRIGNSLKRVSAALSVTKNAGTNWFNSGSTDLATQEIDYFIYLGYNATDGVVIGFARMPNALIYSDFSVTTTNDKYCAISTITNAAASDAYEVAGRFAATLSATAAFQWSVPTFNNSNLIQHPIIETRYLSYAPTGTGFTLGTGTMVAVYRRRGRDVEVRMVFTVGAGGGSAMGTNPKFNFPYTSATYSGTATVPQIGQCSPYDQNPGAVYSGVVCWASTTQANAIIVNTGSTYATNSTITATVPMTWTTSDELHLDYTYQAA